MTHNQKFNLGIAVLLAVFTCGMFWLGWWASVGQQLNVISFQCPKCHRVLRFERVEFGNPMREWESYTADCECGWYGHIELVIHHGKRPIKIPTRWKAKTASGYKAKLEVELE
jgi:hypothetical protein